MGEIDSKIIEAIKQAIQRSRYTSASPLVENTAIEAGTPDSLGLDDLMGDDSTDPQKLDEIQTVDETVETVKVWKAGNLDEINKFGSKQMGNLKGITRDPTGFLIGKVFGKFAKGAGILLLVGIIFEAVKFIIEQLFAPGRVFDIRFREQIDKQVLLFLTRKEQAELRQGFKQVITTTIGGIRGFSLAGQLGGNYYNPERIPANFLDIRRVSQDNQVAIQPQSLSNNGPGSRRGRPGRGFS